MSVKLAFEVVGNGPPVVILHGLFGAGRNWTQIAQSLSHSYRCYLPDARNHGASPWAEAMSYPAMALDVLALIEQEELERPILIGHSMGGKTAMALALEHPHAIAGVAVIDIAPERYDDQFSPYVTAMRHLDIANVNSRKDVRQALAHSLGGDAPVDFLMQNLRRHEDRFDWRINLMATAMCMPDLCGFPPPLLHKHYAGPALFVAGADSDYVRAQSHDQIKRLFPHGRLEHIHAAAHWVHADQPEALLSILSIWLRDVPSRCTEIPFVAFATN
jgi:pimeloyl-ACP methyl ester carboxylesterase